MTKEELVNEIRDALEDVMIYQNQRNKDSLAVNISNAYEKFGITSDDLAGFEVKYSHLSPAHKFRIQQRTDSGIIVLKQEK